MFARKMAKPKLTPHKDAPSQWRVEIPKSFSNDNPKRRRRHFFKTQEEAEAFVQAVKSQQRNLGTSIRILKPAETIDADRALKLLKRHALKHEIRQPTLRDVAHAWIDQWHDQHRSISLEKLFDQFLESRSQDSKKHQQSLIYTKQRFSSLHKTKVSSLTKEDVEDGLWKLPPASYNAHLRRVKSVLNYGVKHGYLIKNPALLVEPIKRPRQSVKILPIDVVELMLRIAQAHTPSILPFLTISLFCGVRPEELGKIRWDDFKEKVLVIRAEVSKTNQHRHVDLKDNMIAWLRSFNRGAGKVMAGWTRAKLSAARHTLWNLMRQRQPSLPRHAPHNSLRHLYCSMFLGLTNDINSLLLQSGHSNAVLFRHYLHIVSPSDAVKYWALSPFTMLPGKIIAIG